MSLASPTTSTVNQDAMSPGQRWESDADEADVFPIQSISKHGNSKVIFVLNALPDWGLISLKKWAEQSGIHYHTARKLKKEERIKTIKIGNQDFLSLEEVKRIAKEGT